MKLRPQPRWLLAAAMTLAASLTTTSANADPLDARVRALYARRDARGDTLPFYQASPRFEQTGMAPLIIEWARLPDHDELARYEALGFVAKGALVTGAWRAEVRIDALEQMQADGVLSRVGVDLAPAIIARPLEAAYSELSIAPAMAALRLGGTELDGTGVVIGDLDSTVDVFHPSFFRADLPVAWLDGDGDGVFTPGVDGFDFDGDGQSSPTEVLHLLDGRASQLYGAPEEAHHGTDDPGYNPGWDYLFLDENGDGLRNSGPQVPDASARPTLGEPLYVADDVNGDGIIAYPEKIVPLGASKIAALRIGNGAVFRRGENLGDYAPYGDFDDPNHATSMLSASAGGQRGHSRWLGIAPGAEIVAATRPSLAGNSLVGAMQFLADEGADVINTELGYWGLAPTDGSTELEIFIDALVQQGVLVVSPAGNLGSSQKHDRAVLPATGGVPYTNEIVAQSSPNAVWMSITWREGTTGVTGSLSTADGDVVDLSVDAPSGTTASGRQTSVVSGTTIKGAGFKLVFLGGGAPLPSGGNSLELSSTTATPANAALFIIDDVSTWGGGSGFAEYDVAGCMNPPSLTQSTIAVGAYALNSGGGFAPYPEGLGQLRAFSGRGPDIFDDDGIDLVAPDNPVTARAEMWPGGEPAGLYVRYTETGGTSGAGAVTAGVAALYRQAFPDMSAVELRATILSASRSDGDVLGGLASEWGTGKLTLGLASAQGAAPEITAVSPPNPPAEIAVDLTVEAIDDGDLAQARTRWDFDYDGIWDTEWQEGLTVAYTYPAGAPSVAVKVEIMDADGWTDAHLVLLTEGPIPEEGSDDDGGGADANGGCGCRLEGSSSSDTGGMALAMVLGLLAARRRRHFV